MHGKRKLFITLHSVPFAAFPDCAQITSCEINEDMFRNLLELRDSFLYSMSPRNRNVVEILRGEFARHKITLPLEEGHDVFSEEGPALTSGEDLVVINIISTSYDEGERPTQTTFAYKILSVV